MVVDSSALLAILLGEEEADGFARAIANDPRPIVGVFSVLETSVVLLARKGTDGPLMLDALLRSARLQAVSMNADQLEVARSAYARFGKGRHLRLSTWATAVRMRSRDRPGSLCCSKERTFPKRMSRRLPCETTRHLPKDLRELVDKRTERDKFRFPT